MKCPKCNADNPDTKQFCGDCGTQLAPVTVTKTLHTPLASPGKTIAGKYKILAELGRGGMGVVYKAKDTRLKRTVALKFLPAELTKDKEAKKRFIQEAQASAALSHPNITVIHEVDEAEDQTFIAMEFLEGQSLKEKLKEGSLDIDEAKDIALQVAKGLEKAHQKGIVHRDIKPANIMINNEGQAKITDFGLAKLSWGVDLTKTSTIMGTVAYMSPEQARGEEVDHRTDIWSLGAMLYEMLSGERPFQKSQEQALIYAILNDKPTPLSLLRSDVPAHLEQVIEKALAKKASEKYQNIQELIHDLTLSTTPPRAEKSIVVLPFDDMSPSKDNEYFSDGLTEEIITDLSKIHSLRVISRNSAMMFKGTRKATKTIGCELDVQFVLEGSVRKAGNNLRIIAQLIDAVNDTHVWAEKYTGTLDDVFDIQEKVSRSIANALKLKLAPGEMQKIIERPIDNVQAYECYLKAQYELFRFKEDALDRAIQHLETGLGIVGENALIYASMGRMYWQYYNIGTKQKEEYLDKAELYARKVFELEPDSSHVHALKGYIAFFRGNQKEMVQKLKKAYELNSNDSETLFMLGLALFYCGKDEFEEQVLNKFVEVDPLNPTCHAIETLAYYMKGQYDLTMQSIHKGYQRYPDVPPIQMYYAYFLAMQNRHKEAYLVLDHLVQNSSETIFAHLGMFLKFVFQGEKARAVSALTQELKDKIRKDKEWSWLMADGYALIYEKEESLDWLEHAADSGFINYPLLSKHDPFLENIRNEPRFKKLMDRVKHEWENFEV
jgi:serine/threonine protein kinase/lipoprotein NlpI